ncbi:uncharacterized protein LOC116351330 [Contarinia nasturtii]|uniref:uncharacterized protein LOC116351330 n=1 Tax=Contarinia nasturtii TaxID=265458 RepID=UPI0012D3DD56|nr:uncharacterized protein LOC116351330 [Contarinia nasturtii]
MNRTLFSVTPQPPLHSCILTTYFSHKQFEFRMIRFFILTLLFCGAFSTPGILSDLRNVSLALKVFHRMNESLNEVIEHLKDSLANGKTQYKDEEMLQLIEKITSTIVEDYSDGNGEGDSYQIGDEANQLDENDFDCKNDDYILEREL